MQPKEFLKILSVAEKLKCNTRHSDTSSGRRESVAEHSWRLALMAMLLEDEFADTDINKVIKMCLIHDLGEAFTGDIATFNKTEADNDREEQAYQQWIAGFPQMQKEQLQELLQEMSALESKEAKLYKALDKLEAVIQHNEADISSWLPLEYDLQLNYGAKEVEFSPYLVELKACIDAWTREKIAEAEENGSGPAEKCEEEAAKPDGMQCQKDSGQRGGFPTREQAEDILKDAESCNPGAWAEHSRHVARCAERIAAHCEGLDTEKAYVCGLLHDVGRKFGVKHFGHIYDGYKYMSELGYNEVARICLTHSFSIQNIEDYIGNFDVTEEQVKEIRDALYICVYDDYDRLIQLCDSMAGADGVVDMEERMSDVKRRYGSYPQQKWDMNLHLKDVFEEKAGKDIYEIVK